jgi:predicted secreted protein
MSDYSALHSQEPEVKYLVANLCEAYQDGLDIWASRVQHFVIGEDVQVTQELRRSFETGYKVLGHTYMNYFKQAGEHFARGDCMCAPIPDS